MDNVKTGQQTLGRALAKVRAAGLKAGLDADKLNAALLAATNSRALPTLKRLPSEVAMRACALLPNAGDAAILVRLKNGGVRVYTKASHRTLVESGRRAGKALGGNRNAAGKGPTETAGHIPASGAA